MLIQASQLAGRPVGAASTQEKLGKIHRMVFDPTNGRLLALSVRTKTWFQSDDYLVPQDILAIEPEIIVIGDPDQISPLDDLVRAQQALALQAPIVGQHAVTESGTALGKIDDVLLETDSWTIVKYYVKKLLDQRIFLATDVHSITSEAVVFFDRVTDGTDAAIETEPAPAA